MGGIDGIEDNEVGGICDIGPGGGIPLFATGGTGETFNGPGGRPGPLGMNPRGALGRVLGIVADDERPGGGMLEEEEEVNGDLGETCTGPSSSPISFSTAPLKRLPIQLEP